jgi:arylsulfatase A-like enzyme
VPFLQGRTPATGRRYAISEYDYSIQYGAAFENAPADQRLFMVADKEWKFVHAIGYRPMLFNLKSDPQELRDLGADPAHEDVRRRMAGALAEWGLRSSQRQTRSEQQIRNMRGRAAKRGILIGVWDESDVPDEYWKGYLGDQ